VVLPNELVRVLTEREIANQNIETFRKEKEAEIQRIEKQQAKGTADMQETLARSQVEVQININKAEARKAEADGEAAYIEKTGAAHGAKIRAIYMARAQGYEAQVQALGRGPTALVNAINSLSEGKMKIIPDVLVSGGSGGALEGLAATLMKTFSDAGSGGNGDMLKDLFRGKKQEKKDDGDSIEKEMQEEHEEMFVEPKPPAMSGQIREQLNMEKARATSRPVPKPGRSGKAVSTPAPTRIPQQAQGAVQGKNVPVREPKKPNPADEIWPDL
jgi:hypothetical protein